MHYLVPLVVALVPLVITPGLLAYFDITPKIAILLFGVSLGLLYRRENERWLQADPPRRLVCPSCGHHNLGRHSFCVECGQRLNR